MIGLEKGSVRLSEHKKEWITLAQSMCQTLIPLFPKDSLIEHIGSTSIPNLKAKPILDLVAGVERLEDVKAILTDLHSIGYIYRPEVGEDSLMYFHKKNKDGLTTYHLHVLQKESQAFKNHLYFRDALRKNPELAKEYEALKVDLEKKFSKNRDAYTKAKESFIKNVIRKAQVHYFLGKVVDIAIDRPIGTTHPKHQEIRYPINYGYIPKEFAPDEEELDVYLLGPSQVVETFQGRIVAIIHRENDVEDKLVMSTNLDISKEDILKQTYFQEQFYKSTIELYKKRRT